MSPATTPAMVLITLALLSYTIGVWSERLAGRLRGWHLVFFWLGLCFDTSGTGMMMELPGALSSAFHAVSGGLAIALMVVHAVWATIVLVRHNEQAIRSFHRFSLFVWLMWLVPYFSPVLFPLLGPR
jgi:uncharacterized repeat protein (TIGR03987 family)